MALFTLDLALSMSLGPHMCCVGGYCHSGLCPLSSALSASTLTPPGPLTAAAKFVLPVSARPSIELRPFSDLNANNSIRPLAIHSLTILRVARVFFSHIYICRLPLLHR